MKTKTLILLSPFVFLALLALNSQGVFDARFGSADDLIDASNGNYKPIVDTRFPTSPQEARALMNAKKETEYAQPNKVSSESAIYNASYEEIEPIESAAVVSGNWSFELISDTSKLVMLELSQAEETVFGEGDIEDGNGTMSVTTSGTVDADELELDLMSVGTRNLYKLALKLDGDSATGEYESISSGGKISMGEARGNKIE